MYIESHLLKTIPQIVHGFGVWEEPIPAPFRESMKDKGAVWKQVHGVEIEEITELNQACGQVDAFYSKLKGAPVAVVTADCVPILMSHVSGKRVAAIHAGWRGTQKKITREVWKMLQTQGEKPSEWVAALGPAIGPCCYEVSEELAQSFLTTFPEYAPKVVVPSFRKLDLLSINTAELKDIGLKEVDGISHCTFCSKDPIHLKMNSYRRSTLDGTAPCGQQFSIIAIRGETDQSTSNSSKVSFNF